jgi:hypothetical protein
MTRERLVAVVPLVGEGTPDDPRRPLFAPKPGEKSPIEGYSWEPTDDGRFAIVEFVAGSAADLDGIANDARTVKAFRKGRGKKSDVERELRKFKRDFRTGLPGRGGR